MIRLLPVLLFFLLSCHAAEPLEVNQWSVFIRAQGVNGAAATPVGVTDRLPSFVVRSASLNPQMNQMLRARGMPTVPSEGLKTFLHFQNGKGKVGVSLPKQHHWITSYPGPVHKRRNAGLQWQMMNGQMIPINRDDSKWDLNFYEGTRGRVAVKDPAWWKTLRDVPASGFRNDRLIAESFFMLEMPGEVPEPVVESTFTEDGLRLRNQSEIDSGPVFVLFRDGEDVFLERVRNVKVDGAVSLDRAATTAEPSSGPAFSKEFASTLALFGLREVEAEAIETIWNEFMLKGPAFMVISRVPSAKMKEMFPVTIQPAPKTWRRVGLVIDLLYDQTGRLAWMPNTGKVINEALENLDSDSFFERAQAFEDLKPHADVIRGELEGLASTGSTEVQQRARELLAGSGQKDTKAPAKAGRRGGEAGFQVFPGQPFVPRR